MPPAWCTTDSDTTAPSLGRFISRDPLGEAAGPNLYRLSGGDPVNKRDLYGLCEQDQSSGQWGSGSYWGTVYEMPTATVYGGFDDEEVFTLDPFTVNGSAGQQALIDYDRDQAIAGVNAQINSQFGQIDVNPWSGRSPSGGQRGSQGGDPEGNEPDPKDQGLPPCSEFFKDGVVNVTTQSFIMDERIDNPMRFGIEAKPWPMNGWDLVLTEELEGDGRGFLDSPAGHGDYRGHNSLTVYTNEGYSEQYGHYGPSVRYNKRTGAMVAAAEADPSRHWGSAYSNGSQVRFEMLSSAGEPFDAMLTNIVAPIYIRAGLTIDMSTGTVRGTVMNGQFPSFQVFVNGTNIHNSEQGKPFDISLKARRRAAIDQKLCDPSK